MDDIKNAHKRLRATAIVHIIEARHLVGKDDNRLSDPFVRVTVAGKRQSTDIRRNQINATWDTTFMFEALELTNEEYQTELIVLQVFDANTFFRNELIGQFSFGLAKVRNQPPPTRHQIFRRWLVLTDPDNPLEEQGYLQVSVTVLLEGDVPPSHARQDDYLITSSVHEQKEEKILRNPEVRRRGYNFSVKVFRGEYLPITDTWDRTCDPFIVVRFNGTVARTPHAAKTTTPNWNHLLTLPVYTPCFSDTIDIQLYDYVRGNPDRLLATKRLKFTSLLGESFPPSWFNFYGRVDENDSASGWFCDLVRSAKSDIDATAYMGRILMSLNTTLTDSPISANRPCPPIKGPKTERYVLWVDIYRASELPLSWLGGQAMIEVQFGPPENNRQSDWCSMESTFDDGSILDTPLFQRQTNSVRFTCSGEILSAGYEDVVVPPCQFKEIAVALPQVMRNADNANASEQLYDIIINVYVKGLMGGQTRVGYLRIKPSDIWGYNNPPEWHPFHGLVDRQGNSTTPGQILVSASFGTVDGKRQNPRERMIAMKGKKYQLRAFIYQARNLTPTKENGLANARVKVALGGETAKLVATSRKESLNEIFEFGGTSRADSSAGDDHNNQGGSGGKGKSVSPASNNNIDEIPESLKSTNMIQDSLNPVFYEVLMIDNVELPSPLSLSPDIEIRVCDDDNLSSGDYIGRAKFPAPLCTPDLWPVQKRPRWLKLAKTELSGLKKESGGISSVLKSMSMLSGGNQAEVDKDNDAGEILVKLELIELSRVKEFPIWSHRWPRVIPTVLNLGTVGLRQLEEYGVFGSIDKPFVRVAVQSIPNMLAPSTISAHAVSEKVAGLEVEKGEGMRRPTSAAPLSDMASKDDASEAPTTTATTSNNNAEEGILLAKQEKWRYTEPPFKGEFDVEGRLPDRWLNASPLIQSMVDKLLKSFVDPNERFSNLFHPQSDDGIAVWTNRASKDDDDKKPSGVDDLESRPVNNQEEESQEDEEDLESGARTGQIIPGLSEIEKERARRTFFCRETLLINMPVDPFYSPSITIQVLDERFFGDVVIATTTVNTRDFASKLLYTEAMKRKAVSKEHCYEIPKFAMAMDANEELRKLAAEDSDAEREEYFDDTLPVELGDDGVALSSTVIDPKEDIDGESQSPNSADGVNETFYDDRAEGHYQLPLSLAFDVEEMNNFFEDNPVENMIANGTQFNGDAVNMDETPAEGQKLKEIGGIAWPQAGQEELENSANVLEASAELLPLPFHSFTLYRGIRDTRIQAGIFKAALEIRPADKQLEQLYIVRKDFRPATDSDGRVLTTFEFEDGGGESLPLLSARENDLVLMERVGGDMVYGGIVKYRPGNIETKVKGAIPESHLEPLGDPLQALYISPDVKAVADSRSLKEKKPMIHPITEGTPQLVKVRVYIVACSQLTAKNMFKNSDPYLIVQLNVPPHLKDEQNGATYHNSRASYKANTINPFFGTWFELDACFPDISELEVQVWNANYISDELIGSTRIDLEDRFFNPQWHQMKFERKKLKEFRPLRVPGSNLTQGICEMWVEIFRPEEAANIPIVDIRAPKPQEWELRLVVWETRKVPLVEDHTYANLYVTGELLYESIETNETNDAQYYETDTHTGLKDGRGIFNFRMKFEMEAPCRLPRLKLKIWERWLLSHTALGEANIDLSWLVREATRTQKEVIDRPRTWVTLTHSNTPGETGGDLDIQMSLVTKQYAELNFVGNARDPPNENPYLPDPPRESLFAQVFRSVGVGRSICCILCIIIPVVIVLVLVFKG